MHHILYRLLTLLLSPVILGHIIWLSFKNKNSRYFWQRLGFNHTNLPPACIWFHCASVGEVNTLLPLLINLKEKDDKLKFIITTNTITGAKIVRQQNLDYLFHSYLPFDWIYSIKCFLFSTQPAALYVMETEIWPNLFFICKKQNIPIRIINARLSVKSTSANSWVKALLKSSLLNTRAIYTRSEKDTQAYKQLGADENTVHTTGNLKFCAAINQATVNKPLIDTAGRDYVLVASTHQDEEKQIYATWKELKRDELLIIAPRHPERNTAIIKQLQCEHIASRSKKQKITTQTEVFLLDTVGELKTLFAEAKFVVMGGSFVDIGGHNILEPASYNKAIITGPYMENFREELDLMTNSNAIIHIASVNHAYTELKQQLLKLLDDEKYRTQIENNTTKITHDVEKTLKSYTDLMIKNIT